MVIDVKLMICGSRGFPKELAINHIANFISVHNNTHNFLLVHGGCKNSPDVYWKDSPLNYFNEAIFPAKWDIHGKKAGIVRNEAMVKFSDYILIFWDGQSRGTASVIEMAKQYNKPYQIIRPDGSIE